MCVYDDLSFELGHTLQLVFASDTGPSRNSKHYIAFSKLINLFKVEKQMLSNPPKIPDNPDLLFHQDCALDIDMIEASKGSVYFR